MEILVGPDVVGTHIVCLVDRCDALCVILGHCPSSAVVQIPACGARQFRLDLRPEGIEAVIVVDCPPQKSRRTVLIVLVDPYLAHLVRDIARYADPLEAGRVEGTYVGRRGPPRFDEDRGIRTCPVERPTVGKSALGQVPPVAANEIVRLPHRRRNNPLARFGRFCTFAQTRNDVIVVTRIRQIYQSVCSGCKMQQMRMCIDKTRHHSLPVYIDDLSVLAGEAEHVVTTSRADHQATANRQRVLSGFLPVQDMNTTTNIYLCSISRHSLTPI